MIFDLRRKSSETHTVIRTPKDLVEHLSRRASANLANIPVTSETAFAHGPVYSCVKVLAESVGQLPLSLFVRKGDLREKAEEHPVHYALSVAPNEYQTPQEFLETVIAHLCLRGNSFTFINRGAVSGLGVLELLPLNPDAVTPARREDGSVAYKVRFSASKEDVLTSAEVLHIKAFSLDGLVGVSPITHARDALAKSMAVEQHAARFFSNGANPGGVMATDNILSEPVYNRLKESWDERHKGVENAHKIAILEQGLKWTQVGLSAEDAQMLESQKYGRTEICGLFRVPPSMIGDLERATFSNTEQQAKSFIDYSLMPYLTRIEQRVRLQLLAPKERRTHFAKFNVNALLRSDTTSRGEFYTRQIQNGVLSPNEVRKLEDMNPRDGGDVYLTPSNMLIDGELPEGAGGSRGSKGDPDDELEPTPHIRAIPRSAP